ncbi:MAG TPA: hypothetical protein ENI27_04815 [bacterium]|nr:hypothetical protein [bacterium]
MADHKSATVGTGPLHGGKKSGGTIKHPMGNPTVGLGPLMSGSKKPKKQSGNASTGISQF